MVPVLPFLLRDRFHLLHEVIQTAVSQLLTTYCVGSLLFAIPAGWLADYTTTRQGPYLLGIIALLGATIMQYFTHSMPLLFLSRMLQGLSTVVVNATGLAMIMDTVGATSLGQTLGTVC